MIPEIIALIDGGTYDSTGKKYTAPVVGQPVTRKPFKLELYCANLDSNGNVIDYIKFTFNHCKGTPIGYTMKDNDFYVPELVLRSTPATGESPYTWEVAATLPTS
jgi:hypothetical protein